MNKKFVSALLALSTVLTIGTVKAYAGTESLPNACQDRCYILVAKNKGIWQDSNWCKVDENKKTSNWVSAQVITLD